MATNTTITIGKKFKNLRKSKNMTLKQLSETSGLSIGYLSNLERDTNSPTLDNIQKLCGIMDISINELLEDSAPIHTIIRKNERKILFKKEGFVCYESINFGKNMLDGLIITLEPHCCYDDSNWIHNYDEIGLIIKGSMEIKIDKKKHHLETGDSFYIKAKTNHSLSNNSDQPCISYWVNYTNE